MQAVHMMSLKKYLSSYHKLQVLPLLHLLPPSFSHQLLLLVTHLQRALEAGWEALPSAQQLRGRPRGRPRAQAHRLGELQLLFNLEQSGLTMPPTSLADLPSVQPLPLPSSGCDLLAGPQFAATTTTSAPLHL